MSDVEKHEFWKQNGCQPPECNIHKCLVFLRILSEPRDYCHTDLYEYSYLHVFYRLLSDWMNHT